MAMVQTTRTGINATDYYQLPEYQQHDLIQLINGEVIISMPPILKHQTIVKKILALLIQVEAAQGGLSFVAPTEVHLDDENIFEPDVLYIAPANLAITQQDEKRIIGAPDLIVEVLSPSTAKYDRQEKYNAYEQRGVREYWIVDPLHETIEVWTLSDERFQRQGAFADDDTFASAVLGERISVEAIFKV
jgi:Uma2 family endonuclease